MAVIDPEKVAADWGNRGFSCDVWVDPPGQRWENFAHEVDELVMVLEGVMEFDVGGKLYHPEIGEEVLIPSKVLHASRNIGDSVAQWLYGYRVLDS